MTTPSHYDVIIIGAGLAGSAAAAILSHAGLNILLLDKDTFPRDKLCGEFLSGESARLLQQLGCLPQIQALHPATIHHMTFHAPTGRHVTIHLPAPAFGVSRLHLDSTLLETARHAGAHIHTGADVRHITPSRTGIPACPRTPVTSRTGIPACPRTPVTSRTGIPACPRTPVTSRTGIPACPDFPVTVTYRPHGSPSATTHTATAPLVIAAYGRHSHLDAQLHRPSAPQRSHYLGFKRHNRFAAGEKGDAARRALDHGGEMYLFRNGYCGICRIENDQVNLCMLLHQDELRKAPATDWHSLTTHLAQSNPAFAHRLAGLTTPDTERTHTVAHVPFGTRETYCGPILFAGDSAGMITPLCGDGQAMALESGITLANLILQHPGNLPALQTAWSTHWKKTYHRRLQLGRLLQPLMMHPTTATAGITLLQKTSKLTRALVKATRSPL